MFLVGKGRAVSMLHDDIIPPLEFAKHSVEVSLSLREEKKPTLLLKTCPLLHAICSTLYGLHTAY